MTVLALTTIGPACGPESSSSSSSVEDTATQLATLPVTLHLPAEPLFVASYVRVPIKIDPASNIDFDALEFEVSEGDAGGLVSLSRESSFDPQSPEVMLAAGHSPGDYTIEVREGPGGPVVGEASFEITGKWSNANEGPSFWFDGIVEDGAAAAAWGGGGAGPENIGVREAPPEWRVAVVFLAPGDADLVDEDGIVEWWEKEVTEGVDQSGEEASVIRYFDELSYGALSMTATFYHPDNRLTVELPQAFEDYFDHDADGDYWEPRDWQELVTAADELLDYTAYDSVVFVTFGPDFDGGEFAWPFASPGKWTMATEDGRTSLGMISMPARWDDTIGRRYPIRGTLSHEILHNLKLQDLYATPQFPTDRPVGGWDIMDWDGPLPYLSVAHRMMLGWIPESWVLPINFELQQPPIEEKISLSAVAQGDPGDRDAVVEVRMSEGWNYYFEYRRIIQGLIGDNHPPRDWSVVGTDVVSYEELDNLAHMRRSILLLQDLQEGLRPGEGYLEVDPGRSEAGTPFSLEVHVDDITEDGAELTLRYDLIGVDPAIRPRPASPERKWQSPDIVVENERTRQDPDQFFNLPWVGNPNDVIATIHNHGDLDAVDVNVRFCVVEWTATEAGPCQLLGVDSGTVPAGGQQTFSTQWVPPREGHYCIVVEIDPYVSPDGVLELNVYNNKAWSNYGYFISQEGSPWSREATTITIFNDFEAPARFSIHPSQDNPLYRVYLGRRWVRLAPGERREIEVMAEYVGEVPPWGEHYVMQPNHVALRGMARLPDGGQVVTGGADLVVRQGLRTAFDAFKAEDVGEGTLVSGEVTVVKSRTPAPAGSILLTITGPGGVIENEHVSLANGEFQALVPHTGWLSMQAYYVPAEGYGDAWSDEVTP